MLSPELMGEFDALFVINERKHPKILWGQVLRKKLFNRDRISRK
jgi:hypothetical protein